MIFWVQLYCFDEICLSGDGCAEISLNVLYKITFHVSLSYLLYEVCLNEYAETSLCCHQMAFSRPSFGFTTLLTQWALSPRWHEGMCRGFSISPSQDNLLSKPNILTQWALSPGRPEQLCECFPVHILYKPIFWVYLLYWLDQLLSTRDTWRNKSSPVSLRNSLYKTILPLKVSYQLEAASPGRMPHLLAEWLKALSPRRMIQSSVSLSWANNNNGFYRASYPGKTISKMLHIYKVRYIK